MEKLLAIITILQRAGGKRLLLRLFSRVIILLGLVITTAIMVSATLIGGLINAHIAMLSSGMSSPLALLIIGVAALFTIIVLIAVIVSQLKGLHRLPKKSPLMDTLDAFTDGLMAD
jgi:uncharacterized BrkB/YihY/UPF0761 family membrane protein